MRSAEALCAPATETVPEACPAGRARSGPARLSLPQPGALSSAPLRAMLAAAGWDVAPWWAGGGDAVAVWGAHAWSRPGRWLAASTGRPLLSLEDGFLRSVRPGTGRAPPLSLTIDDLGLAIDASRPSRLERLIEDRAGEGDPIGARAEAGIARLRSLGLSKYNPLPRGAAALPPPGYVLVVDQTRGDASVRLGAAGPARFGEMLAAARAENPGAPIVVKTHPDAATRGRQGHFSADDLRPGETLLARPVNPWDAIDGAAAVYTVSSQLGYEALLAGKEVHVFGLPFYAGWGLTRDRLICPRRRARPSRAALFAATHLLYPLYWDPYDARLTGFEETLDTLSVLAAAAWADAGSRGAVYAGFGGWKRRHMRRFAPEADAPARHRTKATAAVAVARREERRALFWASRHGPEALDLAAEAGVPGALVEDGFLRSVGLGASLTDAASLVFDPVGIHYDPSRPSRLETLIGEAAAFGAGDPRLARARAIRRSLNALRLTKYNLPEDADRAFELRRRAEGRQVLLVPGQVADDASVRLGAAEAPVRDNAGLLAMARERNPEAFIVYKPHPDVEAGLRRGQVPAATLSALADHCAEGMAASSVLGAVDRVCTLTSLIGFEALLRGVAVDCVGAPFYAGWGLTRDLGPVPSRRVARPSLDALVWAAMVAYPRYIDPVTGLPASPERVMARLAAARQAGLGSARGGPLRRCLAGLQALAAGAGLVFWR